MSIWQGFNWNLSYKNQDEFQLPTLAAIRSTQKASKLVPQMVLFTC
jgi:hypothetical protein